MYFSFMIPLDWLFKIPDNWVFLVPIGLAALAMFCGLFGSRPVRFSLFFGGLAIGSLVVIIPKGVL